MGEKSKDCQIANVPFIVHEGEMTRLHAIIKRQWVAVVLSVLLAFSSVICMFGLEYSRSKSKANLDSVAEVVNEDYQS